MPRFFLGASLREFRLTDDTVLDPEYAKLIREARAKWVYLMSS